MFPQTTMRSEKFSVRELEKREFSCSTLSDRQNRTLPRIFSRAHWPLCRDEARPQMNHHALELLVGDDQCGIGARSCRQASRTRPRRCMAFIHPWWLTEVGLWAERTTGQLKEDLSSTNSSLKQHYHNRAFGLQADGNEFSANWQRVSK